MSDVTLLLKDIGEGDPKAAEHLLRIVYEELRRIAGRKMAGELPGQTLQATALVHEAWLRLVGNRAPHFENRAHFFGAAAEAMRRILVDAARRKRRLRHGGQLVRAEMQDVEEVLSAGMPDEQLLMLDEVLDRLAAFDSLASDIVKVCFFVGLTHEEAARELKVSLSTVERRWGFARAWLFREIQKLREH